MALANTLKSLNELDLADLNFENLGSWPPAIKIFVGLALFALLVTGGYYSHIEALQLQLENVRGEEVDLRRDFEQKAFEAANLEAYKRQMVDELAAHADITAHNSSAALTFDDRESAVQTLEALRATSNVMTAYILDPAGDVFARYVRDDTTPVAGRPLLGEEGYAFFEDRLALMRPIVLQDEHLGAVYIEGDLTKEEQAAFANALTAPADPLTDDERREWIATLDGVSMISDGFIPFRDNIDHAQRHGVRAIAEPGGSTRDGEIEEACREYGITLVHTGVRLFHH